MPKVDKDLSISLLLDFYGAMLTDNQYAVIDYYYNQDYSLAEIAQLNGISRQGVRDSIKRAEKLLLQYEEKLKLFQRFHTIENKLEQIEQLALGVQKENFLLTNSLKISTNIDEIIKITQTMNQ